MPKPDPNTLPAVGDRVLFCKAPPFAPDRGVLAADVLTVADDGNCGLKVMDIDGDFIQWALEAAVGVIAGTPAAYGLFIPTALKATPVRGNRPPPQPTGVQAARLK